MKLWLVRWWDATWGIRYVLLVALVGLACAGALALGWGVALWVS